jgi:hypothetical protein
VRAIGTRRHEFAVIAAGDNPNTVRTAGEDRTRVNVHALLVPFSGEEQLFFSQNKDRRAA